MNSDYESTGINEPYTRRVPLIAASMSAALPGFGQLYNGQINRAIWFFLIFSLVTVPLVMLVALYLPAAMMIGVLVVSVVLALVVWFWGIIDAWRVARKLNPYKRKPWQTTGLYTIVFLLCATVVLPIVVSYVRQHQVQPFKTPSGSMSPTVQRGDFIWANMNYNCTTCWWSVKHGDVVIFVYPNNRNLHYIKRIVGMPGDVVASVDNIISVNGEPLSQATGSGELIQEQYEDRAWTVTDGAIDDFSVTVEPGYVFVLGDNRANSNDSRVFGQVPLADVVGRARQVWFSKNDEGVRWSRLGMSLLPD